GVRAHEANKEVAVGLGPRLLYAGHDAEIGPQYVAGAHESVEAARLTEQLEGRHLRRRSMGRVFEHVAEAIGNAAGALELHLVFWNALPRQDFTQHEGKPRGHGVDG